MVKERCKKRGIQNTVDKIEVHCNKYERDYHEYHEQSRDTADKSESRAGQGVVLFKARKSYRVIHAVYYKAEYHPYDCEQYYENYYVYNDADYGLVEVIAQCVYIDVCKSSVCDIVLNLLCKRIRKAGAFNDGGHLRRGQSIDRCPRKLNIAYKLRALGIIKQHIEHAGVCLYRV